MQYVQYDWGITKIPGPPKPVTLCFLSFKKLTLSNLSAYLHLSCRSEILKHHQRWYIWKPWPTNTLFFTCVLHNPKGSFRFPGQQEKWKEQSVWDSMSHGSLSTQICFPYWVQEDWFYSPKQKWKLACIVRFEESDLASWPKIAPPPLDIFFSLWIEVLVPGL